MNNLIKILNENKTWIFDGIGVAIITFLLGFIFKKKNRSEKTIIINQKGGKSSVNLQNNNIKGGKNGKENN